MNIVINSIKDKSNELNDLFKSFEGGNYVVQGELITFEYQGEEEQFDLQDLKTIYLDLLPKKSSHLEDAHSQYNSISGEINFTSWSIAFNEINKNLQYAPQGDGWQPAENISLDLVSSSEYESRKKIFWNLIQDNFDLPPTFVYKHEDYYPSYFSFYVMWGFCYIFLRNGKGMILHAGASD